MASSPSTPPSTTSSCGACALPAPRRRRRRRRRGPRFGRGDARHDAQRLARLGTLDVKHPHSKRPMTGTGKRLVRRRGAARAVVGVVLVTLGLAAACGEGGPRAAHRKPPPQPRPTSGRRSPAPFATPWARPPSPRRPGGWSCSTPVSWTVRSPSARRPKLKIQGTPGVVGNADDIWGLPLGVRRWPPTGGRVVAAVASRWLSGDFAPIGWRSLCVTARMAPPWGSTSISSSWHGCRSS